VTTAVAVRTMVVTVRTTPIVLLPRRTLATWTRLAAPTAEPEPLTSRAQRVVDFLGAHGASFFDDLLGGTRLLQSELEDALAEALALHQAGFQEHRQVARDRRGAHGEARRELRGAERGLRQQRQHLPAGARSQRSEGQIEIH